MAIKKDRTYQEAYYDNEADANKQMSYVNAAAGALAIVIWLLYLTKVFTIPDHFFVFICVLFPVIAVLMFIPLFFVKTDYIRKPGYKYFILFSLLAVICALNVSIPKHSVLFWPFAILIANHYYNPTIGRVIYGVSIILMLICIYLGMFFGEFDENLFGGGVVLADGSIGTVETIEERLQLLRERVASGDNRYLKVFLFYYFPRAMIVSLFFMVSNLLNKRTYTLLDKEIKVHDEQEKAKTELGVAKEIQLNTLPDGILDSKDVEIVGELKAAKEVGGDLYNYLLIDDDHVGFFIGDVSGKGVPAALFMTKANMVLSHALKKLDIHIAKFYWVVFKIIHKNTVSHWILSAILVGKPKCQTTVKPTQIYKFHTFLTDNTTRFNLRFNQLTFVFIVCVLNHVAIFIIVDSFGSVKSVHCITPFIGLNSSEAVAIL